MIEENKNREEHPALNINFKRIMIKATILAFSIVISTVMIVLLVLRLINGN